MSPESAVSACAGCSHWSTMVTPAAQSPGRYESSKGPESNSNSSVQRTFAPSIGSRNAGRLKLSPLSGSSHVAEQLKSDPSAHLNDHRFPLAFLLHLESPWYPHNVMPSLIRCAVSRRLQEEKWLSTHIKIQTPCLLAMQAGSLPQFAPLIGRLWQYHPVQESFPLPSPL